MISFLNFLDRVSFTYITRRNFYTCRVYSEEIESKSKRERRETDSVLFSGGLLWNISAKRIKRLIDRYSFSDWFLINIKVHWFV